MNALLRAVIVLAIVAVAAAVASPWLRDAGFVVRLVFEPAPTTLPLPVAGVSKRAIANTWGAPRAADRRHQGIDIFAPRGAPVISTTEGLVWRIGQNALGGTVVWVLGPGRQLHYYAHLDRIGPIRERQRIATGDVLGFVGNSGNAARTPPHLHYGIYSGAGRALNPYPLLVAPPSDNGAPSPTDTAG